MAGKILCFGHWEADYGDPIDWTLNPMTNRRWDASLRATEALAGGRGVGDVKLTWEAARFPQAYHLARAAVFEPAAAARLARAFAAQIAGFRATTPFGRGIHWSSGQEIAIRWLAWIFGFDVLLRRTELAPGAAARIDENLWNGAHCIEEGIAYAQRAVYNNHLLSESLGLYLAGTLFNATDAAARWRGLGRAILEEEAERQFYPDGGYLNLSHNYHRNVVQLLLWASAVARLAGDRPAPSWLRAMDRSIEFLVAHQNPSDGRFPNFGPNDGSLPSILSTCDFSDFRPTLQAAAGLVRGERLYDAGPWDEEAVWWLGAKALDAPLRPPARGSRSFTHTGFHVLRGKERGSFVALRCGSMLDRFGQIDMLHVDVWWRGLNVLVDGGSYLYNGPEAWHAHFVRTASHNTVTVDGRDQMLHFRKFKHLYWTEAKRLAFEDGQDTRVVAGEHYGYVRHAGRCVHRRAVAMFGGDLVVVVDRIEGEGEHALRLHWLAGGFPFEARSREARVTLATPEGPYQVAVFVGDRVAEGSVVAGQEDPPRGWQSRYYGAKTPAPSLAVEARARLPFTWISVLGPGGVTLRREGEAWVAECATDVARFDVRDGLIARVADRAAPAMRAVS